MSENLFVRGNSKLGEGIFTWSLPAAATVCVGATALCAAGCYAKKGFFRMRSTKDRYASNMQVSQSDDFVGRATAEIAARSIKVLRIHVSGDFYDAAYIEKWRRIMAASPGTTGFAFTRSWRKPELQPALERLAALPNVHMWLSEDRESVQEGRPPAWPRTRSAFLVMTPDDEQYVPDDCQLVFRDREDRTLKRVNGVLVCPYEQKIDRKVAISCTSCKLCYSDRLPVREPLLVQIA